MSLSFFFSRAPTLRATRNSNYQLYQLIRSCHVRTGRILYTKNHWIRKNCYSRCVTKSTCVRSITRLFVFFILSSVVSAPSFARVYIHYGQIYRENIPEPSSCRLLIPSARKSRAFRHFRGEILGSGLYLHAGKRGDARERQRAERKKHECARGSKVSRRAQNFSCQRLEGSSSIEKNYISCESVKSRALLCIFSRGKAPRVRIMRFGFEFSAGTLYISF